MYKGSDKILQLHCKWSWWREETPTAHASKSDGKIRQRLQFTIKLSSSMQRYAATVTRSVQCTSRIYFQRTEDSLSAFTPWATLGFTVSFILQRTVYNTNNVWHVGKRYICKQKFRGVLPEKLCGGVLHASRNPYPISDQNLWFFLPNFRPDQKFDTLFETWSPGSRPVTGARDKLLRHVHCSWSKH